MITVMNTFPFYVYTETKISVTNTSPFYAYTEARICVINTSPFSAYTETRVCVNTPTLRIQRDKGGQAGLFVVNTFILHTFVSEVSLLR